LAAMQAPERRITPPGALLGLSLPYVRVIMGAFSAVCAFHPSRMMAERQLSQA
jgi:hypothetical protein